MTTESTFADDEDTEPVSDDDQPEDADTEESTPAEGSDLDNSEPTQDEGQAESNTPSGPVDDGGGNDGGGDNDDGGGSSGGGSAPAATSTADADKKDGRKKWQERKAEWEKRKQERKDAVAKSIARNQKKEQARVINPTRTAIPQVASVTQRVATATPASFVFAPKPVAPTARRISLPKAPATTYTAPKTSKTPARRFGHEEIAWEFGETWGAPFDPTGTEPYSADNDESAAFGVLTIDDMVAIERYMKDTLALTPEATKIKDAYIAWFDGLYWWQKSSQDNFDKARNYRNQFNLANAPTAEAKAAVQAVITSGLSKEQAQGDADRRNSAGMYPNHPDPWIPLQWEIAGVAIAALTLLVGVHAAASRR